MTRDDSYGGVMARRAEIMRRSIGIDYDRYEIDGGIAFDYAGLADSPPPTFEDVRRIQRKNKVGETPLLELSRLSALARQAAPPGYGARIMVKDEAANAAGSFKARRASICLAQAADGGFAGVIAATSGNSGAAIASQAAMYGLKALILQEVFDSNGRGQPEVLEKTPSVRGLRCRGLAAHRRSRAVLHPPPPARGNRLLQRQPVHPLCDPGDRDARLRDRRRMHRAIRPGAGGRRGDP